MTQRTSTLRVPVAVESDGPNMILLLFVIALVIGILVGLGARSLTRHDGGASAAHQSQADWQPAAVSAEASALGYRSDWDYSSDRRRASFALGRVMAGLAGEQRLWENPESGNRGVVWSAAEHAGDHGTICRDLVRRTLINNAFRSAAATVCRDPKQAWPTEVAWQGQ